MGLVFQDPDDQLFMPTVAEDVSFGPLNQGLPPAEVERRVGEALAAVRMSGAAERAPHQLSMGERRRVAIATVLAMRPSLLVLDEPSANLDPRARRELLDILERIDRTMLLTTHDLPLAAELCERAVILADGRIVADAECHELLADSRAARARTTSSCRPGFALDRVTRRPRPAGDSTRKTSSWRKRPGGRHGARARPSALARALTRRRRTHTHPHSSHEHEHTEHEHEHSHGDVTHSHPHTHEAGEEHGERAHDHSHE